SDEGKVFCCEESSESFSCMLVLKIKFLKYPIASSISLKERSFVFFRCKRMFSHSCMIGSSCFCITFMPYSNKEFICDVIVIDKIKHLYLNQIFTPIRILTLTKAIYKIISYIIKRFNKAKWLSIKVSPLL